MHLEQIRQRRRVRPRQQLLDVLEEPLAAHVAAEQLFLKRPTRPVGERRLARVQRGLVEQRDSGEDREPGIGRRVARGLRFLLGSSNELQELRAKHRRVGHGLAIAAKTRDRGEQLLKYQRKTARADRRRRYRRERGRGSRTGWNWSWQRVAKRKREAVRRRDRSTAASPLGEGRARGLDRAMCVARLPGDEHRELQHALHRTSRAGTRRSHGSPSAPCRTDQRGRISKYVSSARGASPAGGAGTCSSAKPGNRSSRELEHELPRADFRESRHRQDRVADDSDERTPRNQRAAAIEAARVGDRRAEQRVVAARERNDHGLRGDDHVEVLCADAARARRSTRRGHRARTRGGRAPASSARTCRAHRRGVDSSDHSRSGCARRVARR